MNTITNTRLVCLFALLVLVAVPVSAGHVLLNADGHLGMKESDKSPVSSFLLKFDLSQIPEGVRIDLAELSVVVNADSSLGRRVNMMVHAAVSNWTTSATPTTESVSVSDTLVSNRLALTRGGKTIGVNLTELVSLWHSGELANNGLLVTIPGNSDKELSLREEGGQLQAKLSVFFSK